MDNLEKHIKEHQDDFEYIKTDAKDWEAIQQQLNAKKPATKVVPMNWWRTVAALFAIGLGGYFLFINNEKETIIAETFGLEEEMQFPDIALKNPNGDEISVSDLKGKIVLVDFWASYCMMCTEDHCYYFKPIYNDYKDHGFEIYSISVDENVKNWRQAIEKDSLNWIHVSDLMGQESPVFSKYAVNDLPTNYLLNEEGKIIARNVDASDLEETLSTLLAYK